MCYLYCYRTPTLVLSASSGSGASPRYFIGHTALVSYTPKLQVSLVPGGTPDRQVFVSDKDQREWYEEDFVDSEGFATADIFVSHSLVPFSNHTHTLSVGNIE